MKYKVVIADDHVLIGQAISDLVNNFPNYGVLYCVENGNQLIQKFRLAKNIPDIVLLDIAMPEMDGFATAEWIRAHYPAVLVMALTAQDDDMSLISMIKAGARGYLLKNAHPRVLEHALDSLIATGCYYPEWATRKIVANMTEQPQPALTNRENEFLSHCCSEMTYKAIAATMFCSVHTVEGYRDALFEKLKLLIKV